MLFDLKINLNDKIQFCQQLLRLESKRRTIKQYEPKLTSQEKLIFDQEELLSAYQHIIANASGQHRFTHTQRHSLTKHSNLLVHRICRKGFYPRTKILRQQINDSEVSWAVDLPNYDPTCYTSSISIDGSKDTDPDEVSKDFMWNTFDTHYNVDRRTANPVGSYAINSQGYPLNPLGRTGLCGRGELKRWGVNHQTHLVVMCGTSRIESGKEVFKYIMEKSSTNHHTYRLLSTSTTGTNMTAVKATLKTFLANLYQAWNHFDTIDDTKINEIIQHITFVSTAYVDDPKNTDNAWLETSVCCYIQSDINKGVSSNERINLNELFPESSIDNNSRYTWHYATRNSQILVSEREVLELIARRYDAYW